ncbi:polysaccharide deacetylase family protein [Saccharomonospora cyanea]|uniref:Uncharacterized protein n=1 Tax=Saccharomonospora cyanea NA-134 TaxID=882082 RepID=H5XFG8_9PSEU|nr:hypothetical protein [Saccharomonospora cyanea]EHR62591.1 hypothetical protein SaccyDRAFT_3764 [Saccharomonospora cyanea NA-134]
MDLNALSDELGGYEVEVMAACEVLEQAGVGFRVSGFGLDDWRLDVEYDCSIFMENLPDLLDALARKEEHVFFFASQGVEVVLAFVPVDESVVINCSSLVARAPSPVVETTARADLVSMLERFAVDFGVALTRVSPPLASEEPFRSWAEGRLGSDL